MNTDPQPPVSASLTLPPMPTGVWGAVVRFLATFLVLPALRFAMEELDDWTDGEETDAPPLPTEKARTRLPYKRLRPTR